MAEAQAGDAQEKPAVPFFRTLRFRLTATFFLWSGIIQLGLALTIPAVREARFFAAVDEGLTERLAEIPERITTGESGDNGAAAPPGLPEELADLSSGSFGSSQLFAQIRRADGVVIDSSASLRGRDLPFDRERVDARNGAAVFTTGRLYDAAYADGVVDVKPPRARLVTTRITAADGTPYYLQLGSSMQVYDRISSVTSQVLLVALLAGMAGAGVAGWVVAGAVVNRIEGVTRAVRDVSPQRLTERIDLPEGNDEIGRMAAEVNSMLVRLGHAFHSHERFISHVSHELKTPVASLLTEAQVLKYSRPESGDYERFVLSVEDEMRRLGRLVESFLMLARFGHGRRFLAEGIVHVNDICLESVEHSSLLADQHGVALNLNLFDPGDDGDEAQVRGDAELLRVVVDNLIRNAVQLSKNGDMVSVRVDKDDDDVILSVVDQGPGVPQEYLQRIFERFTQAPTNNLSRRGTGLGLTIAKGVVELHGGSIAVSNRPEGGCAFSVRLPVAKERPGIPGGRPGEAAAAVPSVW